MTKTQAFSHWLKEYLLNVFMQTFHAVTYAVIVQAGITSFESNGNWFFLVICITFLFSGERILRKIFSMGSGFGTVKDLGDAGLAAWGAAAAFAKGFKGKAKEDAEEEEKKQDGDEDDEGEEEDDGVSAGVAGNTNAGGIASGAPQRQIAASTMGAQANLANGRQNPELARLGNAQAVVNAEAQRVRSSRGRRIAGGVAGAFGGAWGAAMGATYQLASGQDVGKVAVSAAGGWSVGNAMGRNFVAKPIIGISNAFAGRRYKRAVLRGDYDESFKEAGLDFNEMESETANLIRKALAEQTSAAIRRGEKVGTYKFYKTINKG